MVLLSNILSAIWQTAQAMAPWLLFGFLVAGVLSLAISPALVCRFLGRVAGKKAVAMAVLIGVPLPLCSCGVLPLAASLKRGGASRGAIAAFLISTPQTGIDSFFATGSLLGWFFALTRPLVAAITGLIGGVAIQSFDDEIPLTPTATQSKTDALKGVLKKCVAALQYGYGTLMKGVAPALMIGLLISALILVFVPEQFFNNSLLGNDWIAFPAMLLIGMPMYVCSTASIPVALALMAKGISPGAALIFLIVGPALNGASLAVLLQLLGKKCMAIYLLTISIAAVLAGLAFNAIEATWHFLPNYAETTEACCESACALTATFKPLCASVLFALLAWHLIIKRCIQALLKTKKGCSCCEEQVASEAQTACSCCAPIRTVTVKGMRCDHCRGAVLNLLKSYPSVTEVTRVDNETFHVKGVLPETLATDIQQLGFKLEA